MRLIKEALERIGYDVWEPFERNNQVDFSAAGWARAVGKADADDVKNADAFFGVVNGTPPDEGVCVELGLAIAYNKPIFLFKDDFRKCTDSEEFPLNLMLFYHLPKDWREYYIQDISSIETNAKLVEFASLKVED